MTEISCEEVLAEVERYVDGELDVERTRHLAIHLNECSPCLHRADFQRRLREIVRSKCAPRGAPESLLLKVRAVMRFERIEPPTDPPTVA
ncbi:MAG TPA: mycothiol system anti-sigma-R factor [Actinomycetota bacterium]|nr:mycothiol system anti-sigma-R factor [Actinomycetota bacterium]